MEKTNKTKFRHFLVDLDDKCLVLKIDFSVAWSKACEIIAMFDLGRRAIAEKLVKELDEG